MMRTRTWAWRLCIILAAAAIAGCPIIKPRQYSFTSADNGSGGYFWNILAADSGP